MKRAPELAGHGSRQERLSTTGLAAGKDRVDATGGHIFIVCVSHHPGQDLSGAMVRH